MSFPSPKVGPDAWAAPSHHVLLTDRLGVKTPLLLVNSRGELDPLAIRRSPFARTGLKISQGSTKYDDSQLPYRTDTQDDWIGGRAGEYLDDDTTRFYDSYRAHTEFDNRVHAGGRESYQASVIAATGPGQTIDYWWASSVLESGVGPLFSKTWLATRITVGSTGFTIGGLYLYAKPRDMLGNLEAYLYSETVGGQPDTSLGRIGFISPVNYPTSPAHNKEEFLEYYLLAENTFNLTAATNYYIVLKTTGTGSWWVGYRLATTSWVWDATAGAWTTTGAVKFFHRVVSNRNYSDAKFFKYKGSMYAVNNYGNQPEIWLNGDRGTADASAVRTVVDATKVGVWADDQWNNCVVMIVSGPASFQSRPYRTIFDTIAATGELQTDYDWEVIPGVNDDYVIIDTDRWQSLQLLDAPMTTKCTDVAVCGNFVYFCFGSGHAIIRYRGYNLGGVWTTEVANETIYAEKMLSIFDPGDKCYYLWGSDTTTSNRYYGQAVQRMRVPPEWGALYNKQGNLLSFDQPWDDQVIANVTPSKSTTDRNAIAFTVAAGFTTGLLAAKYLDTPVDITRGTRLCFAIKSSVACSAADLKLVLSDSEEGVILSSSPYHAARMYNPVGLMHQTATATYTDMANARDADTATDHATTLTAAQYIVIVSAKPFDRIRIDLGTTENGNASVLTAEHMSGQTGLWLATTITDGTIAGGSPGVTMSASGDISFTAPFDWQPWTINNVTGYCLRLKVDHDLTAAVNVSEVRVFMSDLSIDLPALVANIWTWVSLSITPLARPFPDDSAIKSVGLYLATNLAAQVIELRDYLEVAGHEPERVMIGTSTPIRKMIGYGTDRANPYIITWDGIYEVQTENGNAVIKVPLEELSELSSPRNGVDATTNDVYLYFNMAERLERYHNQTLEDIGPNRDLGLGLPYGGRAGEIVALASMPGGVYAAISQGPTYQGYTTLFVPSVLQRKSSGWHELYRGPVSIAIDSGSLGYRAMPIYDIAAQPIPGGTPRLWIAQGAEILSIPIMISASENHGKYLHEASYITSWITMGFLDVPKTFRRLKLYTEQLYGYDTERISVYYQLEETTADWTLLSYASNLVSNDYYCVSPFETKLFPAGVSARRMRLKFVFTAQGASYFPTLRAWTLDALLVLPTYHVYTLPVLLSDGMPDAFTQTDPRIRAETILSRLDTYALAPPEVLTMNSEYSIFDNKTVIVQPIPAKPKEITIQSGTLTFEAHVLEITLVEV